MVEHSAVNRVVAGSSPARGAEKVIHYRMIFLCLFFKEEVKISSII